MSKPDTYNRARLAILNNILSFPTIAGKDWQSDSKPIPGSLVSLSSAPITKWYLSWVEETELNENGFHRYLLRSVEDQELCWWTNVGIDVYSPIRVREHPEWQWTDRQFAFNDRWRKVCYGKHDAYLILPMNSVFDEDGSVTLALRERWGGLNAKNPFHFSETFDNWKKVTMADMSAFYLAGCEYRKTRNAA